MASDSLNQVGKYIGKTRKNADRALNRDRPIQPRLERVRDIFDETTAFEMSFKKLRNDERVTLDLFFYLPPPSRGCDVGCIHSKCEEYFFVGGGNHELTTKFPYDSGTISIFIDGIQLEASQFNEVDPESGAVFFQSGTTDDITVAICYITLDCGIPELCPQFTPSFSGGLVAFSDRFARLESTETTGGVGWWYEFLGTEETPYAIPIGTFNADTVQVNPTRYWMFEDRRAAGVISEIIIAFDARQWILEGPGIVQSGLQIILGNQGSVDMTAGGIIHILKPYRYMSSLDDFWHTLAVVQTFTSPIDLRQKVFMRFYYDGDTYNFKVWPQDGDEPFEFMTFTQPLPTPSDTSFVLGSAQWLKPDFLGGQITSQGGGGFGPANGSLQAIEHWVGLVSGVHGDWNYDGAPGDSWSRGVGHRYDGTYWDAEVESDTITEFGTVTGGAFGSPRYTFPTFTITAGWRTFDPFGPGKPIGASQSVVSWDTDRGKTPDLRITGEVQWTRHRETAATPPLTILIQSFDYGDDGPPGTVGDAFNGTTKQTILANYAEWYPFEIVIPATHDGKVQWGVRFQNDPQSIVDGLAGYAGSFFLESTSTCQINIRRVYTDAVTNPIGGAPFCP